MGGRSWYYDTEDELDERNEQLGKAFIAGLNNQSNQPTEALKSFTPMKLYTHKGGQMSFFEEISQPQVETRVGSTRAVEYVLIAKQGHHITKRTYIEEYGPELDD